MLSKSKVKYIQSLSHKKLRDEEGVFVAEGPKVVADLLDHSDLKIKEIFATRDWISENEHGLTEDRRRVLTELDQVSLNRISFQTTPHQVLAVFYKPVYNSNIENSGVSLLLDTIQDPGNMGTIIRSADWFGVGQIVCSENCADLFAPKVVQASMGSVGRMPLVYTELSEFINRNPGMPVYAATLNGESVYETSKINSGFILIGNESKGVSEELRKLATHRITIPGRGRAESLNAAVATAVILSHLVQ